MSYFGNGMIFSEGEEWRWKRKIMAQELKFECIMADVPDTVKLIDKVLDDFENQYWSKNPEDKKQKILKTDLKSLMRQFSMASIVQKFFGNSIPDRKIGDLSINESIVKLGHMATQSIGDPYVILLGKKFVNLGLR